jgi:hypothetical protein
MANSPFAARMFKGAAVVVAILTLSPRAIAFGPVPIPARSVAIWSGGDGPWTGVWLLPHSLFDDPLHFWIDGHNPVNSTLFLDVDVNAEGLTIDEGDALFFLDGRSLTFSESTFAYLNNFGLMKIHAQSEVSNLIVGGGSFQIAGSGTLEMDHSFNCRIVAQSSQGATCVNNSTIRGAGIIGDGNLHLTNHGTITADRALELLQIQPDANTIINDGSMQSENQGVLVLHGGEYDNVGGQIIANDNSHVEIDGAKIMGGALSAIDNGVIRAHVQGPHLNNLTINGQVELGLVRLTMSGEIVNDGEIRFLPNNTLVPGDYAELFLPAGAGDVTLSGVGEMRLEWSKVFSDSAIPPRLVNAVNHTIRGEGLMGFNTVALRNFGTVIADRDNPIVIDPPASPNAVNDGTFRASGLGGFVITGGTFRNNGTMEVLPGSRCFYTSTATEANIENSTLAGGTWRVIAGDNTAFILIPGTGIFFNLADVTLSGPGASFTIINSMLVNGGRFALEDGRNFTAQGAFFSNEGDLVVGQACKFVANGTFTQLAGAVMNVEVAAENLVDGNAKVHVGGQATLGGTLHVEAAPEFELVPGQQIHIMSAGSIVGQFDSVIVPPGMHIRYEFGEVIADVIDICMGDITGDGEVSADDLFVLIDQWGACPMDSCTADLNGDGAVDVADMIAMIDAWGTCP